MFSILVIFVSSTVIAYHAFCMAFYAIKLVCLEVLIFTLNSGLGGWVLCCNVKEK